MQIQKKSLPLHPQLRNKGSKTYWKTARKSGENRENKLFSQKNEKSSRKIWWLRKFALPLHHFRV